LSIVPARLFDLDIERREARGNPRVREGLRERTRIEVEAAVINVDSSALKLAANRRGAAAVPPSTQALYTAPDLELSNRMEALVPLADPFQPAMTPSSVQNIKLAGLPVATAKALVLDPNELKITPVTGPALPAFSGLRNRND
jgi:hypothetical protein